MRADGDISRGTLQENTPTRTTRLRRLTASALALLFAGAVVMTGMLSLGAYCLTTDGGDLRRLAGFAADASDDGDEGGGEGGSCPLPGATATTSTPGGSAMQSPKPQRSSQVLLPPIDVDVHAELETATFALG